MAVLNDISLPLSKNFHSTEIEVLDLPPLLVQFNLQYAFYENMITFVGFKYQQSCFS